ncbi:MAG: RNA methyltransferase [Armatimonadetes bacterium]|nr:RNA methyltransferase [Armatimonadota bacterium]
MPPVDSPRHPAFQAAAALTASLARAAAGRYLVEGERLVRQALAAGVLLEAFVVVEALEAEISAAGVTTWRLPSGLVPRLCGTGYETKLEAVGVVTRSPLPALPAEGLLLLGEGIRDPRNVGVLVRTAEAAGVTAVAFSDDSADPYGRPAVRSSTGSILRQPLHLTASVPDLLRGLRARGVRVAVTSAHAELLAWQADLRGPWAVVVGNEGTGLRPEVLAEADLQVRLPVHGAASSLNVTVAAGAILYEARRQREEAT